MSSENKQKDYDEESLIDVDGENRGRVDVGHHGCRVPEKPVRVEISGEISGGCSVLSMRVGVTV